MNLKDKKFLFICIPEKGHIHPLIGLAEELFKRGASIAFFSRESIQMEVEDRNLKAEFFVSDEKLPDWFASKGEIFAEHQNDVEWMSLWLKTLLIDMVPHQATELRKAIEQYHPDLLISDPMVYATHIVSLQTKIPWVAISSSINPLVPVTWNSSLTEAFDQYTIERAQLFTDHPQISLCDIISPWLNFVYFSEAYASRNLCQNRHSFYVGKSWNDASHRDTHLSFPFEKIDSSKKTLLMALGSQNYYHPELYQTVIDATKEMENLQLIASIGDMKPTLLHSVPQDAILVPYLPQLELMKMADIFLTHGGSNSTLEALANGVPIGIIPLCNDQFFQAKLVESNHVGIILDGRKPNKKTYKEAILSLLNDKSYKEHATLIQHSINSINGVDCMIEKIKQLMVSNNPQRPPMNMEKRIRRFYVSPHLDDVVLSCGMKLFKEQEDENFLITLFTEGSDIHTQRKLDDKKVAQRLNVHYIHLGYADAPFRDKEYKDFSTLLFHHHTEESELTERIKEHLNALCDQYQPDELYFPLGIGGHIDHHITTLIGKYFLDKKSSKVFFYEDAPYNQVEGWKEYRLKSLFNAFFSYNQSFNTLKQQNISFINQLLNKAGTAQESEMKYQKEIDSLHTRRDSQPDCFPVEYKINVDNQIKDSILSLYSTEYATFVDSNTKNFNEENYFQLIPIETISHQGWSINFTHDIPMATTQSFFETLLPTHPLFIRCFIPQQQLSDFCRLREQACITVYGNDREKWILPPMSDISNSEFIKIEVYTSKNRPIYLENIHQKRASLYQSDIIQTMCRGSLLEQDNTSLLWSSATMSMTDEKVLYPEDAYEQLYKSMENLRLLFSQFNLKQYGIEYGFAVEDVQSLNVYYKESSDLDLLQSMVPKFVSRDCFIDYRQSEMPYDGLKLMLEAKCYKKGHVDKGEKYVIENGRIHTESFELHVSEHCNLRCEQCCNLSPYHKERFMSLEEVERICAFIGKELQPDVIKVAGGEPLLHPQLLKILQTIKRHFPDINLRIITNGLLANQRLTEEIMATIDQLWVSDYRSMPIPERTILKIKEMAKKRHVLLNIKDVDQFYNIVLKEENQDQQKVQDIYENCWMKHRCLMVRNNTFFKCTRAAYIEEQQRIYKMNLRQPITAIQEGIAIDDPDFQEKALRYLNDKNPIKSCRVCLGVSGTLFPNRQMNIVRSF